MKEIYSIKKATDDITEELQLDSFLKKITDLAMNDSKAIASMLITPEAWAAKVNDDKAVLHSGRNMNLLRYLYSEDNNISDSSLEDDNEAFISKEEKMRMLLNDIRVSIILHKNECQIAMLTMNKELSNFQTSFLDKMIEKCKEYGKTYQCNMYIGFMNQLTSIDVEGLLVNNGISDESLEARLLEIIHSNGKDSVKHII